MICSETSEQKVKFHCPKVIRSRLAERGNEFKQHVYPDLFAENMEHTKDVNTQTRCSVAPSLASYNNLCSSEISRTVSGHSPEILMKCLVSTRASLIYA